jgi:hypothetical protein
MRFSPRRLLNIGRGFCFEKILDHLFKFYYAVVPCLRRYGYLCGFASNVSVVFKISVPWTEEMAKFSLVFFGFLGSAIVTKRGQHLAPISSAIR